MQATFHKPSDGTNITGFFNLPRLEKILEPLLSCSDEDPHVSQYALALVPSGRPTAFIALVRLWRQLAWVMVGSDAVLLKTRFNLQQFFL